jgi:hypothetical protein
MNPLPVAVSVNAEPPAVAADGDMFVNTGNGFPAAPIVKVRPADTPPPGVGLNTVTVALPALATSAALIAAVSCVGDTYVVVRLVPFQRTAELGTKFVPFTVSVNAPLPADAVVGAMLVVVGTGFGPSKLVRVKLS